MHPSDRRRYRELEGIDGTEGQSAPRYCLQLGPLPGEVAFPVPPAATFCCYFPFPSHNKVHRSYNRCSDQDEPRWLSQTTPL